MAPLPPSAFDLGPVPFFGLASAAVFDASALIAMAEVRCPERRDVLSAALSPFVTSSFAPCSLVIRLIEDARRPIRRETDLDRDLELLPLAASPVAEVRLPSRLDAEDDLPFLG